jgi:putative sigma-54 modulation protein
MGFMKVIVSGKNVTVTNPLKEYAEKKVGKIGRFFEGDVEAQVTLNVEKDRHIVEVTIPVNGMILRGETETHDMYSSIDMVVDKLEKQIEKYKTKIARSLRKTPLKFDGGNGESINIVKTENEPKVVRVKRFAIKPMDLEEAVMQMDLLGHDFFVFSNSDTNEVNVVYKRKDGNYGLIEPELS